MIVLWQLICSLVGLVSYRFRGTDTLGTTFGQRVVNALAFGACVFVALLIGGGDEWRTVDAAVGMLLATMIGWGAHQRNHPDVWRQMAHEIRVKGMKAATTERVTRWLPWVFGRWSPDWSDRKMTLHQTIGMSAVGVAAMGMIGLALALGPGIRSMIAAWDLAAFRGEWLWLLLAVPGVAWGPLYWAGWRFRSLALKINQLPRGGTWHSVWGRFLSDVGDGTPHSNYRPPPDDWRGRVWYRIRYHLRSGSEWSECLIGCFVFTVPAGAVFFWG